MKKRKRQKKSKWLYSFEVKRQTESEKEVSSTNDKGEEVITKKKVVEISSETVRLLSPTRRMYDDAELFYGVELSKGIKAGLLTKALLAKRYEDDGGSMSEREKQEYFTVYYSLMQKENDYQKLQLNLEGVDPAEKERLQVEALYDILDLRRELREMEENQAQLFNQTAENRAKNQVLMWWVLNLGHINNEALFEGDFEARLETYDDLERDGDMFWTEVIKKLAYYISFWYSGQAE